MSEENQKKLADTWDQAFANSGVHIPIGRVVVCDSCNEDWTDNPQTGGLLFLSKAICPTCTARWEEAIVEYCEEEYIRGRCPAEQSFADWVRQMRGPDAGIKVTIGGRS